MQPIETNFTLGVPSSVKLEQCPDSRHAAELLPVAEALQQLMSRPQAYRIGDLAALTDRLTGELMLFSALVGPTRTSNTDVAIAAPSANADGETQSELHAAFMRELEA
jgi:hypothetical protein